MPCWYWCRFARRLPVTVHLATDQRFTWTGIYGVTIGSWFVGAIRGAEAIMPPPVVSVGSIARDV